jgi:hypothetical protein
MRGMLAREGGAVVSTTSIEIEAGTHNGYDLVKRPVSGFFVHYGPLRFLMFRTTREAALRDGETYLRETGRWVE